MEFHHGVTSCFVKDLSKLMIRFNITEGKVLSMIRNYGDMRKTLTAGIRFKDILTSSHSSEEIEDSSLSLSDSSSSDSTEQIFIPPPHCCHIIKINRTVNQCGMNSLPGEAYCEYHLEQNDNDTKNIPPLHLCVVKEVPLGIKVRCDYIHHIGDKKGLRCSNTTKRYNYCSYHRRYLWKKNGKDQ